MTDDKKTWLERRAEELFMANLSLMFDKPKEFAVMLSRELARELIEMAEEEWDRAGKDERLSHRLLEADAHLKALQEAVKELCGEVGE